MGNYSVPNDIKEKIEELYHIVYSAYGAIRDADSEHLMGIREVAEYKAEEDDLPDDIRYLFKDARRIEELANELHFTMSGFLDDCIVILSHLNNK